MLPTIASASWGRCCTQVHARRMAHYTKAITQKQQFLNGNIDAYKMINSFSAEEAKEPDQKPERDQLAPDEQVEDDVESDDSDDVDGDAKATKDAKETKSDTVSMVPHFYFSETEIGYNVNVLEDRTVGQFSDDDASCLLEQPIEADGKIVRHSRSSLHSVHSLTSAAPLNHSTLSSSWLRTLAVMFKAYIWDSTDRPEAINQVLQAHLHKADSHDQHPMLQSFYVTQCGRI